MLAQIARGETYLKSLGLKEVRLRHHGDVARVEIAENELAAFAIAQLSGRVGKFLKELGFTCVGLDVRGHKSGVFNERLA